MSTRRVLVSLLNYNHGTYLEECIERVKAQTHGDVELVISDNASSDGSREVIESYRGRYEILLHPENTGFSRGHNRVISGGGFDFFMTLNPDLFMEPDFIERKVETFRKDPRIGLVAGKLLRLDGKTIDSAGMVLSRTRKNDDRGGGEADRGQYDIPGYVMGVMGSDGMYSREMLEDVKQGDEYFDADFFAYREEVDLSWRALLCGWRCRYEPRAVARHVHEYALANRREKSRRATYLQFRNRYLLLAKNDRATNLIRHFPFVVGYEAALFAWALLFERHLLGAYGDAASLLGAMKKKRSLTCPGRKPDHREVTRFIRRKFVSDQ